MPVLSRSPAEGEFELTLGDLIAPLSRHVRLVLATVGLSWLTILLGTLALPSYRFEAALAMPDVMSWLKKDEPPVRGIPIATYNALRRSLTDRAVVDAALRKSSSGRQIEVLRSSWPSVLVPITSGGKNDIAALGPDETITALALTYSATSAERAGQVAEALGDLVRQALVTTIAFERIGARLLESAQTMRELAQKREELVGVNRSLTQLEAELARVSQQNPVREAAVREVVDVRDGGERFLPITTQVIAVKAERANNEHAIRMAELNLSRQALLQSFARALRDRFEERRVQTGSFVVSDSAEVVRAQLRTSLDGEARGHPETPFLQAWAEGLATELVSYHTQTRFVQFPTVTREFRVKAVVALASLAVIVSMLGAYLVDAVARRSPRGRRA